MKARELSKRLRKIEGMSLDGVIRVELSSGDTVEIAQRQITQFGANSIFGLNSAERHVVLNAVAHTESNGHMFELLRMILGSDNSLPTENNVGIG